MPNLSDLEIAQKYVNKSRNAESRGIDFTLTFAQFKKIINSKKCVYTGILMTSKEVGKSLRGTDLTLERVDNQKGYVAGNVIAVCNAANDLKSMWENPLSSLTFENVTHMINKINELNIDG